MGITPNYNESPSNLTEKTNFFTFYFKFAGDGWSDSRFLHAQKIKGKLLKM
jgi:hypothetical protein